jgi:CHAD domain-containing protein
MAKSREIPDLEATDSLRLAAAKVVEVRTRELFAEAHGVLDVSDIERVHDMRVASRRLRAVLEIFASCFPRAELRAVLTDVKALADALGARRDPDVQIAGLRGFSQAVGRAEQPGVEHLLERFAMQQADGNGRLEAALEHADASDLRGRLEALVDGARRQAAAEGESESEEELRGADEGADGALGDEAAL